MEYKDVFNGLTDQEFAVLYWRCQDYSHEDIGTKFGYSIPWIQQHMTSAQRKLGIPKEMHPARRAELLEKEICPALFKWIGDHPEKIKTLPQPLEANYETVEGEPVEDTQPRRPIPPPIVIPPQKSITGPVRRRTAWVILGIFVCLACLGLVAWLEGDRILAMFATPTPNTPISTQTSGPTSTPPSSPTPEDTATPTLTQTPADTETLEMPPTAVPLPIIEHFNKPMSSVWQVTGDPILTTSDVGLGYDGVLTTMPGHSVSIAAGNTAWSDYIIHLRVYNSAAYFLLGFRVQDLNNMLGIECEALNCNWIVVKDGKKEVLSKANGVDFSNEFTLTLDGENINGLTNYGSGFGEAYPFVTLPPKYQDQFLNGGIYIRFTKEQGYALEIDYIEILPVR